MISIKNLKVKYDQPVLDDLSLDLEAGCVHGLVGVNGSGKTTLLNTLFGLTKSGSGSVLFNGQPMTKESCSFLPTENFYYSYITGREYLSLFKTAHFELDKWKELFHLPLDERVETYSTGMKKKLSLLAIIGQDKEVIMLDEPYNGLDMESAQILQMILERLKKKKTVIVTSHIIQSLTRVCDWIHHLEKGRIKNSVGNDQFDELETAIAENIKSRNNDLLNELL
ncbi:ABC transporter ATP-binding protein [Reichenbachiella ulvae]|uniref:ATP-binding cassette domain-containing protein n=1 Tax=Reichenbachiella ulvae TaxID=2980104 RepID=A0ABT3CXD9_9BACT|nr:ATP-binding cassette domain-containing protein [Reichenbachiella ulvae]MCV9388368.1 ATP-binding cassette domain-containing protein [Reichenbachiella ulvae]